MLFIIISGQYGKNERDSVFTPSGFKGKVKIKPGFTFFEFVLSRFYETQHVFDVLNQSYQPALPFAKFSLFFQVFRHAKKFSLKLFSNKSFFRKIQNFNKFNNNPKYLLF